MSSLERLGEAGWLPDVRSEESLPGQACNQPALHAACASPSAIRCTDHAVLRASIGRKRNTPHTAPRADSDNTTLLSYAPFYSICTTR